MNDNMNIYDCDELIRQIETKASMNDGELTDEDLHSLVSAQTTSIQKFTKLINYIKYLEGFASLAKQEIDRLQTRKKAAENRVENIKRWLLPYVISHGTISAGTHRVSTRKSQGVVLAEGFDNPLYGESITTFKPNKKSIKESIKAGIEVKGAMLEERINVQIR